MFSIKCHCGYNMGRFSVDWECLLTYMESRDCRPHCLVDGVKNYVDAFDTKTNTFLSHNTLPAISANRLSPVEWSNIQEMLIFKGIAIKFCHKNGQTGDTDLQSETKHHDIQQYNKIKYAVCLKTGPMQTTASAFNLQNLLISLRLSGSC